MNIAQQYKLLTKRSYVYNIMPIANIPSVLQNGLLSYHQVDRIDPDHRSIAMQEVQARRETIRFKNGLSLHDYASMYFDYNNPMLYKRKEQAESLCILAISSSVLDIDGCIVSDQNAASRWAKFYPSGEGLSKLDFEMIFDQYWIHEDNPFKTQTHKKQKCAEVLVPHYVPVNYICSACVLNEQSKNQLVSYGFQRQIFVLSKAFYSS